LGYVFLNAAFLGGHGPPALRNLSKGVIEMGLSHSKLWLHEASLDRPGARTKGRCMALIVPSIAAGDLRVLR
jgi:hypothetical protein